MSYYRHTLMHIFYSSDFIAWSIAMANQMRRLLNQSMVMNVCGVWSTHNRGTNLTIYHKSPMIFILFLQEIPSWRVYSFFYLEWFLLVLHSFELLSSFRLCWLNVVHTNLERHIQNGEVSVVWKTMHFNVDLNMQLAHT
jgi:hypothetical protein